MQKWEHCFERAAEMPFATHIKVKILQAWAPPKANLWRAVKSKWSSWKKSLTWDYRYLNCFWTLENLLLLKKTKNLKKTPTEQKNPKTKQAQVYHYMSQRQRREVIIFCNCAKIYAFQWQKWRNLPADSPSSVPFQVPQPFLDLCSQNISFASWQIYKDIKLFHKSIVNTDKQTTH